MSIENIFDEFDEEKKEDKPAKEEATETSKTPEIESVPIPEGGEESKDGAEEEAPTPSEKEDVDDWFEPAGDKSAEDQPIEEEPVKEKTEEESPGEEAEAAETPAETIDDWFEPSKDQAAVETPSEVGVGAVVPMSVEASPIVVPAVTAEVMRESMRQFQSLKASLLDKSTDIATIQNKPFIKRSGWRKFALAFNISDEITKEERDEHDDGFTWRIWVKVWAPNGRSVVGIGACSSEERDFAHLQHDVYATAHTRAKNRALSDLIGSGEVSWEELRGFG